MKKKRNSKKLYRDRMKRIEASILEAKRKRDTYLKVFSYTILGFILIIGILGVASLL